MSRKYHSINLLQHCFCVLHKHWHITSRLVVFHIYDGTVFRLTRIWDQLDWFLSFLINQSNLKTDLIYPNQLSSMITEIIPLI